jgi:hypothetical protein
VAFDELRNGWRIMPVSMEFGWSRSAVSTVSLVAGLSLAVTIQAIPRLSVDCNRPRR